jgi:type IV secretory pathway VirB10-like protein
VCGAISLGYVRNKNLHDKMHHHLRKSSVKRLVLSGKPETGVRFGRKVVLVIYAGIMVALCAILYGILTRRAPGDDNWNKTSSDAGSLTPATEQAQQHYAGISDATVKSTVVPPPSAAPLPPNQSATNTANPDPISPAIGQHTPIVFLPRAARQAEQQKRADLSAMQASTTLWGANQTNTHIEPHLPDARQALSHLQQTIQQYRTQTGAVLPLQSNVDNTRTTRSSDLPLPDPETNVLHVTKATADIAYMLKGGVTVIPAALITGIHSDLPGDIFAQVTENIYDTVTHQHLLIPKGARLYGRYNSHIAYAQARAHNRWERLIFPDGASIALNGMIGADLSGYVGFADQVNHHIMRLIGYGILSAAFASMFQLTPPNGQNNTDANTTAKPADAVSTEIARQFAQLGIIVTQKNLNIAPTITIRPGYRFNVIVNQDMIFDHAYPERVF